MITIEEGKEVLQALVKEIYNQKMYSPRAHEQPALEYKLTKRRNCGEDLYIVYFGDGQLHFQKVETLKERCLKHDFTWQIGLIKLLTLINRGNEELFWESYNQWEDDESDTEGADYNYQEILENEFEVVASYESD